MTPDRRRRRTRVAWLTLSVALLLVATAVLIDAPVAGWVAHVKHPVLDGVVGLLNPIGSGVTLLVMCVGISTACRWWPQSRLREAAWLGALGFACAGLVEFTLKHLVGRARPDAADHGLVIWGPTFAPDVDSFPSGHATSVFVVAAVFAAFYPRVSWLLYTLAAAIALGRVYLERHYVSDILAGALIGVVAAWALLNHPRVRGRRTDVGTLSDQAREGR
jgi:membrane-associated phospholipid phosphatase